VPLTLRDVGADHRDLLGPIHGQAYAGTRSPPNGIAEPPGRDRPADAYAAAIGAFRIALST
jgi:hypothetical protein